MASNLAFPNLHENRTARSRSTASSASAGAVSLAPVKLVGGIVVAVWGIKSLGSSSIMSHFSSPASPSLSLSSPSERSIGVLISRVYYAASEGISDGNGAIFGFDYAVFRYALLHNLSF